MRKRKAFFQTIVFSALVCLGVTACGGGGGGGNNSSAVQEKITITAAEGKTSLILGETVQLTASVNGVTWESEKPDIASVDANGLVTSKAVGSTKITASKNGYRAGTINIKVDLEKITITAAGDKATLVMDETVQLTASKDGVAWSSSDESIATVNNGLVTAVYAGSATITASKEGFNPGTIQITVTRPEALAKLHLEDAEHYAADGWWGTSDDGYTPVYARDSGNASDNQCIAHLDAGDKETLTFTSSAAINAELVLMMASSSEVADMSAVMSAKLNNADLTVPAKAFTGGSSSTFEEFSLGNVNIAQGNNVLELSFLASAPYLDDLAVYSKQAATIQVKAAPAKEQIQVKLEEGQTELKAYIGVETQIELVKPTSLEGVTFTCDKTDIATISDDGKITGLKLGSVNITIMKEGWYSARVSVAVDKVTIVGEIRVEAENHTNDLPDGFHKWTDKTTGIENGHSGGAYITGYGVTSACSLEYSFESPKDQVMTLVIAGASHYQMSEAFNFSRDCTLTLNDAPVTVNPDAQIESNQVMGAPTVEVTIGDVQVKAGTNTFVIAFTERAPALDCFRFMPKA